MIWTETGIKKYYWKKKSLSVAEGEKKKIPSAQRKDTQDGVYSRVTKVLAPWLNFIVQLTSSQPPQMVLKAEMESQETEPSNFYFFAPNWGWGGHTKW